jgi:hypothetical protein
MFLRIKDVAAFDEAPEDAMGVQCGKDSNGDPYLVLGGQVALRMSALDSAWDKTPVPPWLSPESLTTPVGPIEGWIPSFTKWLAELDPSPVLKPVPLHSIIGLAVGSLPHVPQPPPYPPGVYGHVPFPGTTHAGDEFCRYEAWPTSRRIDAAHATVSLNTFAAPISEAQFIACGFGAVARFACPTILPGCFKWTFRLGAGTSVNCGAVIPLFGQSGGGVEVEIVGPKPGPIACSRIQQTRIPAI